MHRPAVNVYNPKTLVLKAQKPRKREVINIGNKKNFLLHESSCTYINMYVCMYVCIQNSIYYTPEITISMNMQIKTLKSFEKICTYH